MVRKKSAAAVLVLGVFAAVCSGLAQEFSSRSEAIQSLTSSQEGSAQSAQRALPKSNRRPTLADRIDRFGRTVFGGLLPSEKQPKAQRPAAGGVSPKYYPQRALRSPSSQRVGSITSGRPKSSDGAAASEAGTSGSAQRGYRVSGSRPLWRPLPEKTVASKPAGRADVKLTDRRAVPQNGFQATKTTPRTTPRTTPNTTFRPKPKTTPVGLADLTDPVLRPLHERLTAFRRSAFGQQPVSEPTPRVDSTTGGAPAQRPRQAAGGSPTVMTPTTPAVSPAVSPTRSPTRATPGGLGARTRPAPSAAVPRGPTATVPARAPYAAPPSRPIFSGTTSPRGPAARVATRSQRPAPAGSRQPPAAAERQTERDKNVLFARKSPALAVETAGPRKISVGKESVYEVTIRNTGEVAGDGVVVLVDLPAWADVVGAEASTGATHPATAGETAEPFRWQIGRLEAMGRERLALRVVPRQSRPFDLAVRWDYRPEASLTMIEVQEPKLALDLDGPHEVLYGQKEIYKLQISNTGTGDSENVVITLMPMGAGDNQPVSHNLGTIPAGGQKSIEVELTARQVGDLTIKVDVRGDGGVQAELAEKVLVRRAALQVDVLGPKVQFVGTVAAYRIRMVNPGNAPARNVSLSVTIPPGAKYLSGVDGARTEANGTKVAWTVRSLNAGDEQTFTVNCSLDRPGPSRLDVTAKGDADLSASAAAATQVEAIADLALEVKDPAGPVPIGKEAVYELRVRNRGTRNAENVEVVAYFSQGIEPTKVTGGHHRISPGQVVFSPISSVAAGADVVLKITARAGQPGNHVFRAEVQCKPLGAKLSSEETTFFYGDSTASRPAAAVSGRGQTPPPAVAPIRTADRRHSTVPPGTFKPMPAAPSGLPTPASRYGQPTAGAPRSSPPPRAASE